MFVTRPFYGATSPSVRPSVCRTKLEDRADVQDSSLSCELSKDKIGIWYKWAVKRRVANVSVNFTVCTFIADTRCDYLSDVVAGVEICARGL